MKRRISLLSAAFILLSVLLTGCAKINETTLTGTDSDIYGKVTAVDGNTVTVDVVNVPQNGNGNQGNPPEIPSGDGNQSGAMGTPPAQPSGDGTQNGAMGTPPAQPSGDGTQNGAMGTPPAQPSGDGAQNGAMGTPPAQPSGDGAQNGATGMPSTGTTGTVKINDTSVLFKNSDNSEVSAELSDISVGKILKISFDGNGKISEIVICEESDLFAGGNNGNPDGSGPVPTENAPASTDTEDSSVG